MKIGWLCGNEEWAFKIITETHSKELPEYTHIFNEVDVADVIYVPTTSYLKNVSDKKRVILHLDSFRALRL